jgi:hypothetical protein
LTVYWVTSIRFRPWKAPDDAQIPYNVKNSQIFDICIVVINEVQKMDTCSMAMRRFSKRMIPESMASCMVDIVFSTAFRNTIIILCFCQQCGKMMQFSFYVHEFSLSWMF